MKINKLSIIIPVYNEQKTIKEIINRIKNVNLKNIEKEIIVVNDGSTDYTLSILKNIQGIKLISHNKNMGKGMAIRTGIKNSTGEVILIQDADLEYNPEEYPNLLAPIISNKSKVVYGSRRLNPNNNYSHLHFYLGGIILTWFTNILYPSTHLTDESTCYKVFTKDILKDIELKCKRFEFCPEITSKLLKKGIKIHEVPISYNPRTIKEGKKINWKDGIYAFWILLKYRINNK
ncbi:glycosyltransferase family 2 protein [Candidatus Pacearchaeota archaeon]|nr:glycosyltransferase family 2 protein [Candidatus Pacearchaeota archaeon]